MLFMIGMLIGFISTVVGVYTGHDASVGLACILVNGFLYLKSN